MEPIYVFSMAFTHKTLNYEPISKLEKSPCFIFHVRFLQVFDRNVSYTPHSNTLYDIMLSNKLTAIKLVFALMSWLHGLSYNW